MKILISVLILRTFPGIREVRQMDLEGVSKSRVEKSIQTSRTLHAVSGLIGTLVHNNSMLAIVACSKCWRFPQF
jgi:hypothetical protein